MTTEVSLVDSQGSRPNDEIHVLLVDDNERWATLLAEDLEDQEPMLTVTVVVSANEAIHVLTDHNSIDCVVADYQMPGVNGIELLERVRKEWSQLPYILITAEGSEHVASAAIDASATDYLIKNPNTSQTTSLVNKIKRAVEQFRLQQLLEESEQRYRTVTEQSRDAIVILQDSRLVFANNQLSELVGEPCATMENSDFIDTVVHPDDRKQVRETIAGWHSNEEIASLHESRLLAADGMVRHCEYTGRSITYQKEQATLMSIRDVTERKERERQLEWERTLNRTVQKVLVQSRDRANLDAEIVDQIYDHGYALAWIGEQKEAEVVPRAVQGNDVSYFDKQEFHLEAGDDSELSVWATRSGEPTFIQDFTDLFETEWQEIAIEHGYLSGAALPLVHNEISYGILTVYYDEPNQFTEFERRLLRNLADTIAYAIHGIERDRALTSDQITEATIQISGTDYYLAELVRRATTPSDVEITVHSTLPRGEEFCQYLSVEGLGFEEFRELATDHATIQETTVITDETDTRVQVVLTDPTPEADLSSRGIVVRSTTVTTTGAILDVEFPVDKDFQSVIDTLDASYGSTSLLSYTESNRGDATGAGVAQMDTGELTEKQAAALEAAFHHGYFEQPRKHSASEIAAALDISHTTFLHHLRAAQQTLFEHLYSVGQSEHA